MTNLTYTDTDRLEVAQLVLQAQQGCRRAFGELFERFERHVFAIALRRLGDYTEAEELCQEVFIQAMQKLTQLRDAGSFPAWLRSITHRMAINRIVRRDPDIPTDMEVLEMVSVETVTPLTEVLKDEQDAQVRFGLSQLRDLDRETLIAFYVRGQSLMEMSNEFDAPLGTIKRRLHVARKRLAEVVEPMAV